MFEVVDDWDRKRESGMLRVLGVMAVGLLVSSAVSCSESGSTTEPSASASSATEVSVSSAPTTSPPATAGPTTTSTTTTTTTAAPTTTLSPTAEAEQQIIETLDAFDTAYDKCFENVEVCDVPALADAYTTPDNPQRRPAMMILWEQQTDNDEVIIFEGLIERRVGWVRVDDGLQGAMSLSCERSSAYDAPRSVLTDPDATHPVDRDTIYALWLYSWEKQPDGRWLISDGDLWYENDRDIIDPANFPPELSVVTQEDIDACFGTL